MEEQMLKGFVFCHVNYDCVYVCRPLLNLALAHPELKKERLYALSTKYQKIIISGHLVENPIYLNPNYYFLDIIRRFLVHNY